MNTALEKALVEFVETLKIAKDFTMEQAPLVVQEYLRWEFWGNLGGGLALLILCIFCVIVIINTYNDHESEIFSIIAIILICVTLPISAINFSDAIKVKVAPRVVLLEKASSLLKSNK